LVAAVLTALLLAAAAPAWGGGGQPPQLCLACHPAHYAERGRCGDCHRGNPASGRRNIAHAGLRAGKYVRYTLGDARQLKAGEALLDQLACRRCHASAGRGNTLATSLDESAARRTAPELAHAIRRPVANMPDFALAEEQVTTLVNALYAGSQGRVASEAVPVKVHFSASATQRADIFSTRCGSCHRILSARLGSVGTGNIGPNLSGLFSIYYPKSFRNGAAWSAPNLNTWLKNPREIRPWARMQPVTLTGAEAKELESIIHVVPGT